MLGLEDLIDHESQKENFEVIQKYCMFSTSIMP